MLDRPAQRSMRAARLDRLLPVVGDLPLAPARAPRRAHQRDEGEREQQRESDERRGERFGEIDRDAVDDGDGGGMVIELSRFAK